MAIPMKSFEVDGKEAQCRRFRCGNSNCYRCGSMTFLSEFRSMMCGPPICRTLGQGSRSMSFRGRQAHARYPVQRSAGDARPSKPPALSRPTFWLGPRAAGECVGDLRDPFDTCRSFEVSCARWHARRTRLPRRVSLRKRAAPRADQPHLPRGGAQRSGRNGRCLPLLFRRVRTKCQPIYARVHGADRSISKADRLSVTAAKRPRELGSSIRHRFTSAISLTCFVLRQDVGLLRLLKRFQHPFWPRAYGDAFGKVHPANYSTRIDEKFCRARDVRTFGPCTGM